MLRVSYLYYVYYGFQFGLLFLNTITFGAIDFIGTINAYAIRFLGVEGSFLVKLSTMVFLLYMGATSSEEGYFEFMLLFGIPAFLMEWWMWSVGTSAIRSLDPSIIARGNLYPFFLRLAGFGEEPYPEPVEIEGKNEETDGAETDETEEAEDEPSEEEEGLEEGLEEFDDDESVEAL